MEQIKEFISQISLNKYYDKRNTRKINKKVYGEKNLKISEQKLMRKTL